VDSWCRLSFSPSPSALDPFSTEQAAIRPSGLGVCVYIDDDGEYVATTRDETEIARDATDVALVVKDAAETSIPNNNQSTIQNSIEFGRGQFDWKSGITIDKAFHMWGQGPNQTYFNGIAERDSGDSTAMTVSSNASAITEMRYFKWSSKM